MSFIDYLKERWLIYTFLILGAGFTIAVYKLDTSFNITPSNATYIVMALIILLVIFVPLDYVILRTRVKRFKEYCELNTSNNDLEQFSNPMDRTYAESVQQIALEYENFKANIETRSAEELELITKWVHNVKVPISAVRLVLESHDSELDRKVFQKLDMELTNIEKSTQRVFYHIKYNAFYNDYKIAKIKTSKLIADGLRGYSNFFSYKKIKMSISGEGYTVITDEKWSSYILSQIISNAVKYTPVEGEIAITTTRESDATTICIRNSGMGIKERDLKQIFLKGYTAAQERSGIKSTGYGLYLSKKICDMMGHSLTVESEHGSYAAFYLTFHDNRTLHHVTGM